MNTTTCRNFRAQSDARYRDVVPVCGAVVCLIGTAAAISAQAADTGRRVRQPVQEYFTNTENGAAKFIGHTHLGTDFGKLGDSNAIVAASGEARVTVPAGTQAGMWHSLAGLARDKSETLDFTRSHPNWITERWQPRITGIRLRAQGTGAVTLELKDAANSLLWERRFALWADRWVDFSASFDPADFRSVKFLNWICEGGTQAHIDGVWFEVELPSLDFDQQVFAASYAKLSRSYSLETGLVRDRAHAEAGTFDSIPATGMFSLASAVAAEMGVVDPGFARNLIERTHGIVAPLASPLGLLPHFVEKSTGAYRIAPGTEFSTVDTAIYLHSMRLAARILRDGDTDAGIEFLIRQIDFAPLRNGEGFIVHGTGDDGVTRLPHTWRDWGGESALVLLLARLAEGDEGVFRMANDGRVFRGVGFIGELQSLFFPQFDADRPDGLSGVNWRRIRTRLFELQKNYFAKTFPDSVAAKIGAFGLSAGEGPAGVGYAVAGVEMPDQRLIHPHYMIMSAALEEDAGEMYRRLWQMEEAGWFTPWGLVENINSEDGSYLPMNGSLNASFESLGAYNLLVKNRAERNAIYSAADGAGEGTSILAHNAERIE